MRRSVLRVVCAVPLLAFVVATTAAAQVPDKQTYFTFSGPVALPGRTLPPGQYLFRIADPMTSSRLIEVRSGNGHIPYGYFFSILAVRPDPAPQPEVRFMETAKGMAPAIETWWYPGSRIGYEFIYSKDQVRRLTHGVSDSLARVSSSSRGMAVHADLQPVPALRP